MLKEYALAIEYKVSSCMNNFASWTKFRMKRERGEEEKIE